MILLVKAITSVLAMAIDWSKVVCVGAAASVFRYDNSAAPLLWNHNIERR